MINRILSTNIPVIWDMIKFAVSKTTDCAEEDLPAIYNDLLQDLLNERAQCFIIRPADRSEIYTLMITAVETNKSTGRRLLNILNLYSFKLASPDDLDDLREFVINFAKSVGCNRIKFESNMPRIWAIGENAGFKESTRTYILDI